jgi:hypothetical protein
VSLGVPLLGGRNLKWLADGPHRSLFDFAMTKEGWQSCFSEGSANGVGAALAVKNATVLPEVPFEVGELHRLGNVEDFANSLCRKVFFGELPLRIQHELQRIAKICFGFFQRFSLGDRGGNLLNECSEATFFSGFEYSSQFHRLRVSQASEAD